MRILLRRAHLAAACLMAAACGAHTTRPETTTMAPTTASTSTASTSTSGPKTGLAPVNGIAIYYEVHGSGSGTPLVLLPGGGSTIDATYGRILPSLARQRVVIAIEEQNHGRSGHRSTPERFTDSADDAAAVLRHLGIDKVDLMGFSNGASIALQVAIRHPSLVRKLVFASSMTKRNGAAPQFWQNMANSSFDDMPQPLKDAFLRVNNDQALLHDMYEKDSERMRNFVETSDEDVRTVSIPTLILSGDRDVPTTDHALELSRLFPNAQLMILPGGTATTWANCSQARKTRVMPSCLPDSLTNS
jgi:pimeloyl-ACP methyl ester carboxylesterase